MTLIEQLEYATSGEFVDDYGIQDYRRLCEAALVELKLNAPRADGMPAGQDERELRRAYAARVGMLGLYMDDGEASGTEHGVSIDFMREPVRDIMFKVLLLEMARFDSALGELK